MNLTKQRVTFIFRYRKAFKCQIFNFISYHRGLPNYITKKYVYNDLAIEELKKTISLNLHTLRAQFHLFASDEHQRTLIDSPVNKMS